MTTVEMCCGQRPIVQTSHGRKVGFCIRCGTEYDIRPATLLGEMQERYVFYMRGNITVEPAIMMKHTDCIAGRRDVLKKLPRCGHRSSPTANVVTDST